MVYREPAIFGESQIHPSFLSDRISRLDDYIVRTSVAEEMRDKLTDLSGEYKKLAESLKPGESVPSGPLSFLEQKFDALEKELPV